MANPRSDSNQKDCAEEQLERGIDLQTNREWVLHVSQSTARSELWVRFDLHPTHAPSREDRVRLLEHGGATVGIRALGQDHLPNQTSVDLHFTDIPTGKRLSLQICPHQADPYYLFEAKTLEDLQAVDGQADEGTEVTGGPTAEEVEGL